jgi:uncharacterized RDD family membrane protein YckC
MTPAELKILPSPSFWRRVFCGLYEQLVLLGVIALTFLLPNLGLGVLFGIALPSWLTFLYLYILLGIYFVWYWTKSGQTLAMQTWRIRIIDKDGCTLNRRQATWRYIFGSLWILPCVALQAIFHLERWLIIEMLFAVALFLWPLSIFLDRRDKTLRQGYPTDSRAPALLSFPKIW